MADRRTRFGKGLKNVTLYGSVGIDGSATLTNSGTITGGTVSSVALTGATVSGSTTNIAIGVASIADNALALKVACGHIAITGSRDINTGLTHVISGGANINACTHGINLLGKDVVVRCPRYSGGPVSGSKGLGYMKIVVKGSSSNASIEATGAASIDWFAIGI